MEKEKIISVERSSLTEIINFLKENNISFKGDKKEEIISFLNKEGFIAGKVIHFSLERANEIRRILKLAMEIDYDITPVPTGYGSVNNGKCGTHIKTSKLSAGKYKGSMLCHVFLFDAQYIDFLLQKGYFFIDEKYLEELKSILTYDEDEVWKFLNNHSKIKKIEESEEEEVYELDMKFLDENKNLLASGKKHQFSQKAIEENKKQHSTNCMKGCVKTLGFSKAQKTEQPYKSGTKKVTFKLS